MAHLSRLALLGTGFMCIHLSSCSKPEPVEAPVFYTPINAKVNLEPVSLQITNAQLTQTANENYQLKFDHTVTNHSDTSIGFACLYNRMNELIEVNLTDAEGNDIPFVRTAYDNITLAQPKPFIIKVGEATNTYTKDVSPANLEAGAPVNIRIRLHAPSRYDELRSSVEAAPLQLPWPS